MWMLLEVVMFQRMAMARYWLCDRSAAFRPMAVKACYTADGRVPFDGVDFLAPGTLRLLSSSLQSFERVQEDAVVYLTAPEPNRRADGW